MSYVKTLDRDVLERLRRPIVNVSGATCDLCKKLVDWEGVVEDGPTWVKVLVRHHGSEQLHTFEFGSREWGWDDLERHMRGMRWFEPNL